MQLSCQARASSLNVVVMPSNNLVWALTTRDEGVATMVVSYSLHTMDLQYLEILN